MRLRPGSSIGQAAAAGAVVALLFGGLPPLAVPAYAAVPAVQPAEASASPEAPAATGPATTPAAPAATAEPTPTQPATAEPTSVPQPSTPTEAAIEAPRSPAAEPPQALAATGQNAGLAPFRPFGAIGAKWLELGGSSGPLKDPTSNEACDASGLCIETFAGGEIHYTPATGAHAVLFHAGRTGREWTSTGGRPAYGSPVSDEVCAKDGCFQRFSAGIDLTWTASAGYTPVRTRAAAGEAVHSVYGGYRAIGYPTSPEDCGLKDNGCAQSFGGLNLMWSAKSGAFGVWTPGAIGSFYLGAGAEAGRLGFPTSKEVCGLKDNGCYQNYQGGAIVWSPASGARLSFGAIRKDWAARGYENGALGYPVSGVECDLPDKGCRQEYQRGSIYIGTAGAAHSVNGGIKGRFGEQGGVSGYLGYPLENEVCNQTQGGCYQWFQGGLIFWSPTTGAQPIRGGMKAKYESMGWHLGYLGYPATPESCSGGECVQSFQGGHLTWSRAGASAHVRTECSALNEGRSKYPTGNANRVLLTFAGEYAQSYANAAYCKRVAGTYVTDWRTDARVGASGFKRPGVPSGPTRYNFSPTGSYSVTEAFGLGNPGTALPYKVLNPNSRWGGNPHTPTYNKYFESKSWIGWDENMWYFATGRTHDYLQGAVLNYNRPPDSEIVQDAGFAIFLHMNKAPTAGCIALDDWAVEDYLRKSVPGDRIIMGVARDIFAG